MKSRLPSLLLGMSATLALTLATPGCARRAAQAPPAPAPAPPLETAAPEPAPEPAPPPVETPAPPPQAVSVPEFDPAFFGFDSNALSESARQALDQAARRMREQAGLRVTIEGHADERGTSDYNMALGERRANAARDYLLASGIASERITVISYGEERPLADGHDESAWARNRCAQMVVRLDATGGAMSADDPR